MLRQLIVSFLLIGMVLGHSRLMEPPNRSSLWRFEEFSEYNPEPNYKDDELWCENLRQFEFDDRCGICGDSVEQAVPRSNEHGGKYGRGILTRTYSSGQNITIKLDFPALHGGYFEIQLCANLPETEECFNQLVLGNGSTKHFMPIEDGGGNVETIAQLPEDLTTDHGVLRLHYRGAQHWGNCDSSASCECDPNSGNPPGGMGCSEQQTFRSCADIKIL